MITKIIWRVMRWQGGGGAGGWRPEQVGVTNIRRNKGGFSATVTLTKISPVTGREAERRYRAQVPTAPGSRVKITAVGPAGWKEVAA
jgi:hypothetical protein